MTGRAPLDGGVVTDANRSFGSNSAVPEVDMAMNAEGARIWATMTANNVGRQIAIVLDGMVYSYPRVNGEITGGRSNISGQFTIEEADDLANVLKSGKLPAPARIVQDTVVGPSLGSESINAGLISFVLAFVLVLIYMALYYNGAGLVANLALLANVIFLFGALVSFGAVLTLPWYRRYSADAWYGGGCKRYHLRKDKRGVAGRKRAQPGYCRRVQTCLLCNHRR